VRLFPGLAVLCSLFLSVGIGHAQDEPAQFRVRTTTVLVPTLVRNETGEIVYRLTSDDFVITDNGVEQAVRLDESLEQAPLSVVVALQSGRTGQRQFQNVAGINTMIDEIVGEAPHQVALVAFGSEPQLISDFVPTLPPIDDLIKRVQTNGDPAILDAAAYSLRLLQKQPKNNRRVLLLISEEHDHGSKVSLGEIQRTLGDTDTVIYSLAFSPFKTQLKDSFTNPGTANTSPGSVPGSAPRGSANLFSLFTLGREALRENSSQALAEVSGGEYLRFDNQRDFDRNLNRVANQLANRYLLSFQPKSPRPGLHSIKVMVRDRPDVVVSSRTAYWATDEVDQKAAQ
jgi:VWFA-related protein